TLSDDEQRIAIFGELGIDVAIIHAIDRKFLQIEAKDFVRDILVNILGVKSVCVGQDFSFGKKAKGDVALLSELGREYGFSTRVVEQISIGGEKCSSTAIRAFLRDGDLKRA